MNRPIITEENSILKTCNRCGLDKPRYRFGHRKKNGKKKLRGACKACRANRLSEQIFYTPEIQSIVDINARLISKQISEYRREQALAKICYCKECNADMGTYKELGSMRFSMCSTCTTAKRKAEKRRKEKSRRDRLAGQYINKMLRNQGFEKEERTPELIELKRKAVKLKREVKHPWKTMLQARRIVHCDVCNVIMGLAKNHNETKCTKCAELLNLNLKDGNTENRKCA
jgi:hypothetical protein